MIINGFKGIHNTVPIRSIPDDALSDAVDVDIDDSGAVLMRNGYALSKALTNATAGYSTLDQTAYVVDDGTLYRILDDLTLISITASTATEFDDFGKVLFTNDGLKIEDDNAVSIRLPQPESPAQLTVVEGELPAGTYSVTYCFKNKLESGTAPVSTIELIDTGGIYITPITPPSGFTVKFYMTDANGAVYYDESGIQLPQEQIMADSMPDTIDLVAFHNSRLWVSQGLENGDTVIWFSKPFHYHLYDLEKDYIIVPGQVRAMKSAGILIIATDSAVYGYDTALTLLAGYGVVQGRPMVKLPEGQVMIHTLRGECIAPPFQNLTEAKVSQPPGRNCSTAVVDQNGIKKLVVLTDGLGAAYNKS